MQGHRWHITIAGVIGLLAILSAVVAWTSSRCCPGATWSQRLACCASDRACIHTTGTCRPHA